MTLAESLVEDRPSGIEPWRPRGDQGHRGPGGAVRVDLSAGHRRVRRAPRARGNRQEHPAAYPQRARPRLWGGRAVPAKRSVVFQESRLIPWQRVLPKRRARSGPGCGGRSVLTRRGLNASWKKSVWPTVPGSWPVTLSGGEAMRVALGSALVRQPQLMFAGRTVRGSGRADPDRMHHLLQDPVRPHRPAVLLGHPRCR